ncbi:MAG: hypothetical protein LBK76_09855 [Verrucomicrobiales bacterium]|jgi:hypothetical protein|nr:hypothetical protein [Verrucomicrobiales bacterium]
MMRTKKKTRDTAPQKSTAAPVKRHGGPRPNSGRKPLPTSKKLVAASFYLPPGALAQIDRERGELSRSKWITKKITDG